MQQSVFLLSKGTNTMLAPTDEALNSLGSSALGDLFHDGAKRDSFLKSYMVPGVTLPSKSHFKNTSLTAMDGSVAWIVDYPSRNVSW